MSDRIFALKVSSSLRPILLECLSPGETSNDVRTRVDMLPAGGGRIRVTGADLSLIENVLEDRIADINQAGPKKTINSALGQVRMLQTFVPIENMPPAQSPVMTE